MDTKKNKHKSTSKDGQRIWIYQKYQNTEIVITKRYNERIVVSGMRCLKSIGRRRVSCLKNLRDWFSIELLRATANKIKIVVMISNFRQLTVPTEEEGHYPILFEIFFSDFWNLTFFLPHTKWNILYRDFDIWQKI